MTSEAPFSLTKCSIFRFGYALSAGGKWLELLKEGAISYRNSIDIVRGVDAFAASRIAA